MNTPNITIPSTGHTTNMTEDTANRVFDSAGLIPPKTRKEALNVAKNARLAGDITLEEAASVLAYNLHIRSFIHPYKPTSEDNYRHAVRGADGRFHRIRKGKPDRSHKADIEAPPPKRETLSDETDDVYPLKGWMDHHTNTICHAMTYQAYEIDLTEPKESSWSTREGDACLAVLDIVNRYIKCGDTPPATLVEELMHRLDTFADLKERGL